MCARLNGFFFREISGMLVISACKFKWISKQNQICKICWGIDLKSFWQNIKINYWAKLEENGFVNETVDMIVHLVTLKYL